MPIGLVQRSAAIWRCYCIQSEPGKLSQGSKHDDSTIKINLLVVVITVYYKSITYHTVHYLTQSESHSIHCVYQMLLLFQPVSIHTSERDVQWIKEVTCIRKEQDKSMNRDKGSYQLSHIYMTGCSVFTMVTSSSGRRSTSLQRTQLQLKLFLSLNPHP